MKLLVLITALFLSLNVFATAEEVTTEGQELHLTCVMNFTPFFIEIDQTHTKAKFYLNNRRDSEGRGYSREFISNLRLHANLESEETKAIIFKATSRVKDLKSVYVTIPKKMSYYLGKGHQPARIDLQDGSHFPGTCYVQFPPMAPQW